MLSKEFKRPRLAINPTTGIPCIVDDSLDESYAMENSKVISREEWWLILQQYFRNPKNRRRTLCVEDDGCFIVGGQAESKEQIIEMLEKSIKEVKDWVVRVDDWIIEDN